MDTVFRTIMEFRYQKSKFGVVKNRKFTLVLNPSVAQRYRSSVPCTIVCGDAGSEKGQNRPKILIFRFFPVSTVRNFHVRL